MFGKDYVSQHIQQTIQKEQKEYLYRIYLTESLWCITHGKALEVHYKDLIEMNKKDTTDSRTPEEVIDRIKNKLSQL